MEDEDAPVWDVEGWSYNEEHEGWSFNEEQIAYFLYLRYQGMFDAFPNDKAFDLLMGRSLEEIISKIDYEHSRAVHLEKPTPWDVMNFLNPVPLGAPLGDPSLMLWGPGRFYEPVHGFDGAVAVNPDLAVPEHGVNDGNVVYDVGNLFEPENALQEDGLHGDDGAAAMNPVLAVLEHGVNDGNVVYVAENLFEPENALQEDGLHGVDAAEAVHPALAVPDHGVNDPFDEFVNPFAPVVAPPQNGVAAPLQNGFMAYHNVAVHQNGVGAPLQNGFMALQNGVGAHQIGFLGHQNGVGAPLQNGFLANQNGVGAHQIEEEDDN